MRMQIAFDGASTDEVRALARALSRAGYTGTLQLGLDGPDCWTGHTPKLDRVAFERVTQEMEIAR